MPLCLREGPITMFIRKIKRKNGSVGICLVESYRENGAVKQRTVKYLGSFDELTKDDPDAIRKLKASYAAREKQESAVETVRLSLTAKAPELRCIRNTGYFWLDKCFAELGLDALCDTVKREKKLRIDLTGCLRFLCFMRALNPCSKKMSYEKGIDYFYEDFDVTPGALYESLTVINECRGRIIDTMHRALCAKYGRKTDIIYYDVTNYFFEIDEEDVHRKKGCSKEHRPNPIVQMGLFIDRNSLPVDFSLYEGNKPDCTTLVPSFDEVKARYSAQKVIVTADKGLNSGTNLGYLLKNGNGYIVSQKIRGASAALRERVLKEEDWQWNDDCTFKLKEFIRSVSVTDPDGGKFASEQKVVCIWSEKYALKEKDERDRLLDRIAKFAADPEKFKLHCHSGACKYLNEEIVDKDTGEKAKGVKTVTSVDQGKIDGDEELDGYYLIVTSETDLSASEIITKYRGLWAIEQSFRITKSDLRTRPVYVWNWTHICAHFTICFITLTLLRMLEIRLGREYSAARIIHGLQSSVVDRRMKNMCFSEMRPDVIKKLEKICGVELDREFLKGEEITGHHKKIMKAEYTTPEETL